MSENSGKMQRMPVDVGEDGDDDLMCMGPAAWSSVALMIALALGLVGGVLFLLVWLIEIIWRAA
jgi:hypothetical protein